MKRINLEGFIFPNRIGQKDGLITCSRHDVVLSIINSRFCCGVLFINFLNKANQSCQIWIAVASCVWRRRILLWLRILDNTTEQQNQVFWLKNLFNNPLPLCLDVLIWRVSCLFILSSVGCHCLLCPMESIVGTLSLRIQQLNVQCDTKVPTNDSTRLCHHSKRSW